MSRPFRLILPAACAALSLGFAACVGTVYDRMYSNKKTHYKPPTEGNEVSAEALLGAADASKPAEGMPADAAAAQAAPGLETPGLPPATPAADPFAVPPPGL